MRCLGKMYKFMEAFDLTDFKKTRYQIKETMNQCIHPHIAKEVYRLYSANNWARHREEQQRQKLIEAQRTGLYHAILRHKRFPNYFLFTRKYESKAQFIDYFDYCLLQCSEKPLHKTDSQKQSPGGHKSRNSLDVSTLKNPNINTEPETHTMTLTDPRRSLGGGYQTVLSLPTNLDQAFGSDQPPNSISMHSV